MCSKLGYMYVEGHMPTPPAAAPLAAAAQPSGGFVGALSRGASAIGNTTAAALGARLPMGSPVLDKATAGIYQHYQPQSQANAPSPITASQNSPARQQMQAAIARLLMAHLMPAGAKMPQILLGQGAGADHILDYMTPGAVHISPFTEHILAHAGDPTNPLSNYARQGLVHELAHTMQNQAVMSSVPMREGGAQAWADKVSPTAIPHWSPYGDTNYSGYVNQMTGRETPNWIMHGQFQPRAPLPTINAPTTPAGAYALQHVMAGIAQAASNAGILGPRTGD